MRRDACLWVCMHKYLEARSKMQIRRHKFWEWLCYGNCNQGLLCHIHLINHRGKNTHIKKEAGDSQNSVRGFVEKITFVKISSWMSDVAKLYQAPRTNTMRERWGSTCIGFSHAHQAYSLLFLSSGSRTIHAIGRGMIWMKNHTIGSNHLSCLPPLLESIQRRKTVRDNREII